MWWYWVVFFSLMGCSFIEQFTHLSKKRAETICFIYMCFFLFVGTIRWNQELGDWKGYNWVFNWEDITSFSQVFSIDYWAFEPFLYIAMRIIKFATNNYTVLLFFMVAVANGCFYRAAVYINKRVMTCAGNFGDDRSIILTMYFAFWATNCASIFTVRTNMAVAICMMSIKAIEEKKPWKFIAMVFVASMFHFVSIIFFIAYPVYMKKFNIEYALLMIWIALAVSVIGLERLIPLIGLLGGRYAQKIDTYNIAKGSNDYPYMSYSGVFLTIRAMANTILILCISLYIKRYLKFDKRFNGLFNIYLLGAFVQSLTISYNLEFARAAIFFINTQFFVLPYIFKVSKVTNRNKYIYFFGYSAFMMVKMYSLLHSAPGYAEFTTIFSK